MKDLTPDALIISSSAQRRPLHAGISQLALRLGDRPRHERIISNQM